MSWFDTPVNSSNFFRWSEGGDRALADIQRPELYEVGTKQTASYPSYDTTVYLNKNNFFKWISMGNIFLYQLQELGQIPMPQAVKDLSGTASGSDITLTWTAREGEVYFINRATNINGPYINESQAQNLLPPYTKENLSPSTTYYFIIRSRIGNSFSAFSSPIAVTTGSNQDISDSDLIEIKDSDGTIIKDYV